MKWAYSIQNKFKAALLLGIIFMVIVIKNIVDERNVAALGDSFSAVYEDRLLVESYIYKLADHLHQKRLIIDNAYNQSQFGAVKEELNVHNSAIQEIIKDYELTRLTEAESMHFLAFKSDIGDMQKIEQALIENTTEHKRVKMQMDDQFMNVSKHLHALSNIQIAEGKILNDNSKKIIADSSMLTQLELALLIGIGLIIQVLIFASKSLVKKETSKHILN